MSGTYWIPFNETNRGTPIIGDVAGDNVERVRNDKWVFKDPTGESNTLVDESLRGETWVPKAGAEGVWYVNEDAIGENPRLLQAERDKSILVLGETGSGKTEAIKLLITQFSDSSENPLIVFDYKDDYKQFFSSRGYDNNLIELSIDGSSRIWNIFTEADSEQEFEEIGRILFKGDIEESQNPFFPQAAQQVFVALLKLFSRTDANNERLYDTLQGKTNGQKPGAVSGAEQEEPELIERLYNLLQDFGERGAAAHINPMTPKQSSGVFSHLQMKIVELFTGDFRKAGDFGIRNYMQSPNGRILLLNYPIDRGEAVKPIYRFYIDWAIRYALQDDSTAAYFVLDEFQTIPGLEKIERLVNAGRARKAYSVLGLQSVAQLQMTYGKQHAKSIFSGLGQEILLRSGDKETTEYIRDRLAKQFVSRTVEDASPPVRADSGRIVDDPADKTEITREEYPVSENEVQQLQPGEAFVVLPEKYARGQLLMLEHVSSLGRLSGILDKINDN